MSLSPVLSLLPVVLAAACALGEPGHPAPPDPGVADGARLGPRAADTRAAPHYRPPVVARVVDGFRPPPHPFGAGNRGIEYETEPGAPVGAIAAGRVVFSGPVAGSRHVTVLHDDGVRSSYSYLATLAVEAGEPVRPGQAIGTAGGRLHLGVRAGDAYLDPARLFDRGRVHLVPTD